MRVRRPAWIVLVAGLVACAVQATSAFGAPTLVGVSKATADPSATLTISRPPGVTAGTVILAVVDARLTGEPMITAPPGWTQVRRDSSTSGASLTQVVYVKVAGSSEPSSYTFGFPFQTGSAGAMLAYSRVDTTSPVLAHSGRFLSSSSVMVAPSVNVSVAGAAVVGLFGNNGVQPTRPPAGMTERYDAVSYGTYGISAKGADYTASSTGATGDKSAQSSVVNSSSIGQLVALRPGSGGGGTSQPPPSAPVNTNLPTISGTPRVGSTLTASTGAWNPSTDLSYAYQWLRCAGSGLTCSAIGAATSATYVPASGDVGWSLAVRVTASNAGGSTAATSLPTAPVTSGSSSSSGSVGSALPALLPPSTGTTVYVSTSGSDSNPGTEAKPWRTIGKALRMLQPGQTALVRAGTYAEKVEWSQSGTASAPITLAAYPGERPIITGRVKIWAAYARLAGFQLVGQTTLNPSDVVLYISGARHLEIVGNEIRQAKKSGVYVDWDAQHIHLIGNWIHDNGTSTTYDHGLYWSDGAHGLVANNVIEDNAAYGIHIYPDGDDLVVTSNTVVGSGKSGIIVSGSGSTTSDRNLLVNNIVAFNADYGIRSYFGSTVGTGNLASNNLGYQNADGDFASGALAKGLTFSGSMSGDPAFVSRSSSNYRLQAGSAALDRALAQYAPAVDYDGRSRPNGAAADLGAFEGTVLSRSPVLR